MKILAENMRSKFFQKEENSCGIIFLRLYSLAGAMGDFISKGAIVVDVIEINLTIENLNVDYSGQHYSFREPLS